MAEDKLKRYSIRLPNKVEFIVREDIFSNGWANSFQNTMTVWIADWDFPIRSTHDWLRDVVTHEFAHLVSIQSGSKLASPIQGLVLGYQDYFNERVQSSAATIIPFTHQPNWFAEGVAQYESELSGFDAWDSHRDMILRTAVLEDKLIGYDRMGTFAGTSLEYEQGPYTQGFAFVKYIAARYGDAAILKLWAENARIHRQTLSGSMERVLGKDAARGVGGLEERHHRRLRRAGEGPGPAGARAESSPPRASTTTTPLGLQGRERLPRLQPGPGRFQGVALALLPGRHRQGAPCADTRQGGGGAPEDVRRRRPQPLRRGARTTAPSSTTPAGRRTRTASASWTSTCATRRASAASWASAGTGP